MNEEELERQLVEAEERFEDRGGLELNYALAFRVLRHLIGETWAVEHVRIGERPDPFMLNELDETSENRWIHQQRVIELADYIYRLRNVDGFPALITRFETRDTRQMFYEASVAAAFDDSGHTIAIREESGQRGSDFDLLAKKDERVVNVEVTTKNDTVEVGPRTITNTLQAKRTQVPDDAPALLFCRLPDTWGTNPNAEQALTEALSDFFRRSGRFNRVTFTWDAWIELPPGRLHTQQFKNFRNERARHPLPEDWEPLQEADALSDLHGLVNRLGSEEGLVERIQSGEMSHQPSFTRPARHR